MLYSNTYNLTGLYFFLITIYSWIYFQIIYSNTKFYELAHPILINKQETLGLVRKIFACVLVEEYIFRVLAIELVNLIKLPCIIPIVSFIFGLTHLPNHIVENKLQIYSALFQFIFACILYLHVLVRLSILESFMVHLLTNLYCLVLQFYFHNKKELEYLALNKKIDIGTKYIMENIISNK